MFALPVSKLINESNGSLGSFARSVSGKTWQATRRRNHLVHRYALGSDAVTRLHYRKIPLPATVIN